MKAIHQNGRLELIGGNTLLGYVEDEKLFGIGADGYAVEIATSIEYPSEAIKELKKWLVGSLKQSLEASR